MRQIHGGLIQIQFQFLRGHDDAHIPDALVVNGLVERVPAGGNLSPTKSARSKFPSVSSGTVMTLVRAGLRQQNFPRRNAGVFQIHAEFRICREI